MLKLSNTVILFCLFVVVAVVVLISEIRLTSRIQDKSTRKVKKNTLYVIWQHKICANFKWLHLFQPSNRLYTNIPLQGDFYFIYFLRFNFYIY